MSVLTRHVYIPFIIATLCVYAFAFIFQRYPFHVVTFVLLCFVLLCINGQIKLRRDKKRGWRVGHSGRDEMYYEERHNNKWRRIRIGGEMLCGKAHHIIYFDSIQYPDWTYRRKDEIINRIKSEFREPDYQYDGA